MGSKADCCSLAAPCLALSAALLFLGTGLTPLWPLTWLAAIPALWLAPRVSGRHAFFVGAAAYALGGLNEWSYSRQVLPVWLVASLLLAQACLFGAGVLLFRGRLTHRARTAFRQVGHRDLQGHGLPAPEPRVFA
jgi:apolipoprotein N-acyltransferase